VSDEPEVLDMNTLLRRAAGRAPAEGGPEVDMNTLIRRGAGREPAQAEPAPSMNELIRVSAGRPAPPPRPESVPMSTWIRLLAGRGPIPKQVETYLVEKAETRQPPRVSQMTQWIRRKAGIW